VTEGRVSVIVGKEKLSIDLGEGVALVREPAEILGVGGLSRVMLFSTSC
jgi:hypothetical protein